MNSQFNSLSLFVVKGKTVFDCWQILGTVFLNCQSLAVSRQMSVRGHYLDRGTHSIDSFYNFFTKNTSCKSRRLVWKLPVKDWICQGWRFPSRMASPLWSFWPSAGILPFRTFSDFYRNLYRSLNWGMPVCTVQRNHFLTSIICSWEHLLPKA